MNTINVWNITNEYFKFQTINNIDELINNIKEGKTNDFEISKTFIPGDPVHSILEKKCNEQKVSINFTDKDHPFVIDLKGFSGGDKIDIDFYNKYQNEIKKAFEYFYTNTNKTYLSITDISYSPQLFDILLNKNNIELIRFNNVKLNGDQIKKLKNKYIDVFIDGEQIYSRYLLGTNTINDIKTKKEVNILCKDINNNNIDNFSLLQDDSIINIVSYNDSNEDYLKKVSQIINVINKINKKLTIKIDVKKRSLFDKYIKNINLNNINLIINNDNYNYSYTDYIKEEEKLENLIKPIKEKNLSPLEKYIAVYNIVKNFKPYKENVDDKNQSRYLRYILDNEYIVCVGYSNLLECLLDKVGINANQLGVSVDTSYDNGFTEEEKIVNLEGHRRCIVSIDDDKYNVHGIYVTDPTWDNNLEKNEINHALMTLDSMQKAYRMFSYSKIQPLLDIHSFKDFNEQVNYLLKNEFNKNIEENNKYKLNKTSNKLLIDSYKNITEKIIKTIDCDKRMIYFYDLLSKSNSEKDFEKLFTELGHYLLTRINKTIDPSKIVTANNEVEKIIHQNNPMEISIDEYIERDKKAFPYEINDDNRIEKRK